MTLPRLLDIERFWSKVDTFSSDCWLWQGAQRGGNPGARYGAFDHPVKSAHRFAYEDIVGPIPEGMMVLHNCDNSLCVNPEHLCLGTAKQNMIDRSLRGRTNHPRGQEWVSAKLSDEQVRLIRQDWLSGQFTQKQLAEKQGLLSQATISLIVNKKRWGHLN